MISLKEALNPVRMVIIRKRVILIDSEFVLKFSRVLMVDLFTLTVMLLVLLMIRVLVRVEMMTMMVFVMMMKSFVQILFVKRNLLHFVSLHETYLLRVEKMLMDVCMSKQWNLVVMIGAF